MSKASEYAKAVKARPEYNFNFGQAIVDEKGHLQLRHGPAYITVEKNDVPDFIKWLRETFED